MVIDIRLFEWASACGSYCAGFQVVVGTLLLHFCGRRYKESAEGQGVSCHGSSGPEGGCLAWFWVA